MAVYVSLICPGWNIYMFDYIAIALVTHYYLKIIHILLSTETHPINWSFTRGKDDFYISLVYNLQSVNLEKIQYITSQVKV